MHTNAKKSCFQQSIFHLSFMLRWCLFLTGTQSILSVMKCMAALIFVADSMLHGKLFKVQENSRFYTEICIIYCYPPNICKHSLAHPQKILFLHLWKILGNELTTKQSNAVMCCVPKAVICTTVNLLYNPSCFDYKKVLVDNALCQRVNRF